MHLEIVLGPSRGLQGLINKLPTLSMGVTKTRREMKNDQIGYRLAVAGCILFTVFIILFIIFSVQQASYKHC